MICDPSSPAPGARVALVFPGQGSQLPAMARALAEGDRSSGRDRLVEADDVLGFELGRLCTDGSADDLRDTAIAQPAILLTSLMALDLLLDRGIRPAVVAGHSLGEYTALVAAGVLDWTDALRLVRQRGLLMAEAGKRVRGGMLAVLDLPADQVEQLCSQARRDLGEVVEVANRNAVRQTVVSGATRGLEAVASASLAAGGDAVRLRVSAPFHCSLMSDVAATFEESLRAVTLLHPQIPVLANTTARPVLSADEVRVRLAEQICGTVKWVDTLRAFSATDVTAVAEVGPGSVLTALSRQFDPEVPAFACSGPGPIQECARALLDGAEQRRPSRPLA